jgi:putative selenate reductase FAD-binding subunit
VCIGPACAAMVPFSAEPSYNDRFTKTHGSGEDATMTEQFHRPATVREAVGLKRRFRARAAYLAGGTWLNSSESGGPPEHVISLAGLGLDRVVPKPGRVEIGALCRIQRLIEDRRVPAPLRAALGQVVSRNLREMATLGGHVAARYAHSDVMPMLLALEVVLELAGPGRARRMCLEEYLGTNPTGLITRVLVPKPKPGRVAACRAFRVSGNARSLVSAAVAVTLERGVVKRPIVALGGVARTAVRLVRVEKALAGRPLPPLDDLQALAARAVRPGDSLEGSAAFRRYEAGTIVALTFRDALAGKGARP